VKEGGAGKVGWTPGANWIARATGDFEGDGKSDILLQNDQDGMCYVWLMDGLNLIKDGAHDVGWTPGKNWIARATGDFDGDGKSDILLQNDQDGMCYVWQMDGLVLKPGGYDDVGWTPGANWVVEATGDYNGDGKSDILLQNDQDGTCYVWEMNGLSLLTEKSHGKAGWTPGADWHATA
jgi:hypothetical protein